MSNMNKRPRASDGDDEDHKVPDFTDGDSSDARGQKQPKQEQSRQQSRQSPPQQTQQQQPRQQTEQPQQQPQPVPVGLTIFKVAGHADFGSRFITEMPAEGVPQGVHIANVGSMRVDGDAITRFIPHQSASRANGSAGSDARNESETGTERGNNTRTEPEGSNDDDNGDKIGERH